MTLNSSSLLIQMIKLLSLVLFFATTTQVACRLSNETDQQALLSFKKLIAEDLLGSLSSWNHSLNLCAWDGVTCSRKHQRVVVLDLRGKRLRGTMSPFLGNLSFLRSLSLQENIFQGKIPLELSRLFRLQHLNLSSNSLQGEIPTNFSNSLGAILLSFNDLVGKIPTSFGSLSKLTDLDVYSNKLNGGIPHSLSNLSLLQLVDLGRNNLTGSIPQSIGHLSNLQELGIGDNKFSEYGTGGRMSTLGDIYSYGILLLEMLTGKRPTDELFTFGQSLHDFCNVALPERVMEIVDPRMLLEERTEAGKDAQNEGVKRAKIRECLVSLMRIGVACSAESPGKRMNVKDVIIGLMKIKEVFLGVGIHGRRQLRMRLTGEGTSRE